MPTIPTDSVLRRHHEQQARASAAQPGPATRPAAPQAAASGGFCGWLKKLFGG